MAERRYSISQAGRLVGVENHVLRYWEDELHLEIPRDRKKINGIIQSCILRCFKRSMN